MNELKSSHSAYVEVGVHADVLKLELVSFLTDVSSEMIFSVFAIFFTTIAGASAALLGTIEGLADLSAPSLDYVAGWLSDRSGKRKSLALAGYGSSTLAKVILLISNSVVGLGVFRVVERIAKYLAQRQIGIPKLVTSRDSMPARLASADSTARRESPHLRGLRHLHGDVPGCSETSRHTAVGERGDSKYNYNTLNNINK
jgi:hypothetical protein